MVALSQVRVLVVAHEPRVVGRAREVAGRAVRAVAVGARLDVHRRGGGRRTPVPVEHGAAPAGPGAAAADHDDLGARAQHVAPGQSQGQQRARRPAARAVDELPEHVVEHARRRLLALGPAQVVLDVEQEHLARVRAQPRRDRRHRVGEQALGRAAGVHLVGSAAVAHHRRVRAARPRARRPVHVDLQLAHVDAQLVDERELLVGVGVRRGGELARRVERVVRADPRRVRQRHVIPERVLEAQRAVGPRRLVGVDRAADHAMAERDDALLVGRRAEAPALGRDSLAGLLEAHAHRGGSAVGAAGVVDLAGAGHGRQRERAPHQHPCHRRPAPATPRSLHHLQERGRPPVLALPAAS